ncbi:MAG: superoxide dismutase [Clostridium sp.]
MRKISVFIMSLLLSFGLITTPNANANKLIKWEVKLSPLPFEYEALEPFIDKETMIIHHNKHEQGYVDNLNKLISKTPELQNKSLDWFLTNKDSLPKESKQGILNNAGGVYNHNFFWSIMAPAQGQKPTGNLSKAIDKTFGTFENFQKEFKEAALSRFGSGWAWLVLSKDGKLSIISTPNQDSPISDCLTPIIGLDVWEHAYYLKYRNMRSDYIDNWWNVVNWNQAETNFNK